MTTERIRKGFKITQKQLSEMFNIPLGTIKNWDARDCMPEYMEEILIQVLLVKDACKKYHEELEIDSCSIECRMAEGMIINRACNMFE